MVCFRLHDALWMGLPSFFFVLAPWMTSRPFGIDVHAAPSRSVFLPHVVVSSLVPTEASGTD